ncbi:hypothetical protein GCM10011390_48540 [Aureimonas endophytica]|uniref:Uncharacterized protein n=1 Tax=Aureimonas endophytica TaxID=2027858 RepID=A0A917A2E2_9HYPH|nr:hypothetical protein [Aureimonas endophytica]GGE23397.1 hypothetical protein GCM10011390_48540 [Aureimonas endophytica]
MENAPDPDEPLTLEEACKLIFREAIKPATLRAEARRGRLVIEKIGRRHFVSRRAIQEMREKARAEQRVEASPPPATYRVRKADDAEASEGMSMASIALDHLLRKAAQEDREKRKAEREARSPKRKR